MRRHGRKPPVNKIPGQQFEMTLTLKPTPTKTDEDAGAGACECNITGFYWQDPETSEFDSTTIQHIIDGGGIG